MEFKAHYMFADMSVRKLRPFASLIRGRMADEALELLRYMPNKGARLMEQTLKSALGNAEDQRENKGLTFDLDDLYISESRIDGGPIMKRMMPRARGNRNLLKRRYSHIRITLASPEAGE
jgi:large subunit ribosomal protein L22